VTQGQCVFLRNEQTGREILCKVLEWRQVAESGYVDLEFTTRDPHFWDAPAAAGLAVPAAVAPATPVAVVAPRSVEALDMLPASAPAPTGTPASDGIAAASAEGVGAAAIKPPAHHTAEELEEAEEALIESEDDGTGNGADDGADAAERDDTKDAELLAKLIATDPKRKPKRESAAAETKEPELDALSEDAPEHGATSAGVEGEGETEAAGGFKATLVAKLTPLGHKLHRLTYGNGAMGVGIAASVLLVIALGFGWHAHRVKIRSKNLAAAAVAQAKQAAAAQATPTTAGKSGASAADVEAPAHGNNSGATPAQAAQKIQQQTGAPNVNVAAANNASASAVPPGAPAVVPTYAPKLEARESVRDADQETADETRHRHARGPNGGETIPARIVSQSPAAIPPWAKGLDTGGEVKLDAVIDEKGNVRSTKPLSGPRLLQHAAERAVALWIFEPALMDGKPTATHMVLTVEFQR
jgi:Flp pilus assembly protein TadG